MARHGKISRLVLVGNVRQIGSTAKPLFDYGPAIEYNNWNTDHPIIDSEHTYSDGTAVNNWDKVLIKALLR